MNTVQYFDRMIEKIRARIAEHDGTTDHDELEYVAGLEDALSIVEAEAAVSKSENTMLYHVEVKSSIDGRWIGARVGHSMTRAEAETTVVSLKSDHPQMEYRVAGGTYPT